MVEEKPVAALTLSLIGLALHVIGSLTSLYATYFGWSEGFWGPSTMMGPGMMIGSPWFSENIGGPFTSILAVVAVAFGSLGVLLMKNEDLSRVRTGSTLVLVASIITFSSIYAFMLGSLLMLLGGIIGLTWQPVDLRRGVIS